MRLSVLALVSGLGVACSGSLAAASDIDELCSGSANLSDGQWARYAADAAFMKEKVQTRFAVVGSEGDHYWLEVEAAMPTGTGAMIIKVLIPGWPYEGEAIKRALMQLPKVEGMDAIPPMEMPPASIQKDNLSGPLRMACEERQNGVKDSVTVPAGTFDALRIPLRVMDDDIWVSPGVPFGIVKMADADGYGLELIAYGDDAEPAMTETPQKVPGAEGQ